MTTYINPGNNTGLYGINDININTPYGNANVESFLATGSDTGGNVVGNIVATGNVTAAYYFGDGSQLTGIGSSYSDANVVSLLSSFGSNTVVTTGNITGGNFIGSGAALTSITGANVTGTVPLATSATTAGTANTVAGANVTGTVANATFATSAGSATTATSATTAGTVTTAAQPNITSVGTLTSLAVTGNISGNYYIGNGSLLTGITGSGTYSDSNVVSLLSSFGSNTVSTTGNITAGYFLGDGSQLTNISVAAGSKIENGSTNVNIATSGGNIDFTVPTLGTVMKVLAGNGAVTMQQQLIVDGDIRAISNGVVSAQGNVTGGNLITGGVVSATGAITGGSLVSGTTISAAGNITGGNLLVNGGGLGTVTAGYLLTAPYANITTAIDCNTLTTNSFVDIGGELDVAGNISAPLSSISGGNINASGIGRGFITATANISAGGNILTSGYITAGGNITSGANISATGNIAASYFVGNGSLLTGITTTYGNANVAAFLPTYTGDLAGDDLFLNIATGNAYIIAREIKSSTQTITGGLTVGSNPGDAISTVGSVVGNVIQGNSQINSSGTVSATGNITGGNLITGGLITATGNIGGGNLNTAGNVTGTYILGDGSLLTNLPTTPPGGSDTQIQYNNGSAFGGVGPLTYNDSTGNVQVGNIVFNPNSSPSQINNIQDMSTSTGSNPGRILIGNGYNGNISNDYDFIPRTRAARVAVWGSHTQGSETVQSSGLVAQESVTLTANTNANLNSRSFGISGILQLGGGVSAYNFQQPYTIALAAQGGLAVAGTSGNSAVGNTVVTALGGTVTAVQAQSGATITNAVGYTSVGVTAGGTVTNFAAFAPFTSLTSGTAPSSYSILFNPSSGAGSGGVINSNSYRSAADYYFLKNDDAVAQNKLGSLRSYTEFNGVSGTTSGSLTIDKTAGQVQQVDLSGNITGITFSNFVSSASDSVNTDEQADTVTVIFNQGATGGYGVTFPTGSTYKYAGNVTALESTAANSVSLVSISAIRLSGTTTYLITISPGFV